ncbi:hypothetical protein [Tahibacter amnicola]|uniref:Peptide zinc metalloprotease protein n=1 Tax=Tahibacter amnicola TaxID=2976241 RepID=A0ABY6BLH7_9GAMM|nr:hypothetical protein [Tahibacter amnicola]UXI70288.1 hypothetical protein N4264_11825 [Tahibacter amnicola]
MSDSYFLAGPLRVNASDADADATRWCICVGERVFLGSAQSAGLLTAIAGASDTETIACRYNAEYPDRPLTVAAIEHIIRTEYLPARLVLTVPPAPMVDEEATRNRYIYFSRTLVSASAVERIATLVQPLLAPGAVVALLPLCLLVLVAWNVVDAARMQLLLSFQPLGALDWLVLYATLFATFLFHEFGHAGATRRYGARPAQIGIGLYLIFPVLFCNVTEAWRLPRSQRIAINLAGAWFQILATAFIAVIQHFSQSRALGLVVGASLFSLLITLNPFLRFDGYWVYADYFRLPNLRERSGKWWAAVASRVLYGDEGSRAATPTPLVVYAIASGVFFVVFTVFVMHTAWATVTNLPQVLTLASSYLALGVNADSVATVVVNALSMLLTAAGFALMMYVVFVRLWAIARNIAQGIGRRVRRTTPMAGGDLP